jgi:hypothetical protein
LDKLEGQTAKFELELVSEQGEVLSGQKLGATMIPPTSAMPSKETQMDAPPALGKSVQELKMQACFFIDSHLFVVIVINNLVIVRRRCFGKLCIEVLILCTTSEYSQQAIVMIISAHHKL